MLDRLRLRMDQFVRRRTWLAFAWAVWKKFGEDRAGQQAALISYYGFFSIFPLLLVAVTVLGGLLRNNPELQDRLLRSALSQFPIIGDQIRENIHAFSRSGFALVIGLLGALWGGLGGIKAMQDAMDRIWGVPYRRQPGFLKKLLRGAIMLAVLGAFVVFSTVLAAAGAATESLPFIGRAVSLAGSLFVNVFVFALAFKVLTAEDIGWRDVLPGAIVAGIAWAGLQSLGGYFVTRQLSNASRMYGFFGIVLGLLSWIYLAAQITLLAAEVNVVKKFKLWPRSVGPHPETEADREALERYAKFEERSERERVDVRFRDAGEDPPAL